MAEHCAAPPARDKGKQPRVLADPHVELPVKNHKYVKNCVELYLAQRGIDEIARFDDFVNLEVLWLNDNRIEKLEGLDKCFRIKELYAQGNRIRSLNGSSLVHFKFLRVLRLSDNKLRDFATTLAVLAKLHHLEDLDLFGNSLQEEDNYRLHVVRAVPSLLVLDRHVVTEDERARAARLCDEPASDQQRVQRREKREVVAGAPPQSTSSTVKMLFKEVETIAREREAARKEALAQELARMNQQQQQLTHQPLAPTSSGSSSVKGGLEAWELAALEKQFRALEPKPKSGVTVDRLPVLLAYLGDRGFEVRCNDKLLLTTHENKEQLTVTTAAIATLFPTPTVQWQQFQQSLEKRLLECRLLSYEELKHRADAYFALAAGAQKHLNGANTDDTRAKLTRESHDAAQRAYHLAALADKIQNGADNSAQNVGPRRVLSPLRTRYYATTFAREETETPAFHELRDQSTRVSAALSAKYKIHQKDFQKYMTKQAPPATTLVRRHFNL